MPEELLSEIRLLLAEREKLKQAEIVIDEKLNALVGLLPKNKVRKPKASTLTNSMFVTACNNSGARP